MRVLHLAVLLVVCGLGGQAATLAVESQLWTPPQLRSGPPPAREPAVPGLGAARLAELLDLVPRASAPPEPPFALLGTLAPTWASVWLADSGAVRTVGPGDELAGAEILAIARGAVLVRLGDHTRWLTTRAAPATPTAARTVARAEVLRALDDFASVAGRVHIVPRVVDGRLEGFKLYGASRVPLLVEAGLQDGDLIRSINGLDASRPGDLASLLSAAATLSRIDLELVRNGAAFHHAIALQ